MSRRAVVFGAAGQLGNELVRELHRRRFTVSAWDRSEVDITDPAAVQNALANYDAEVVFNAAAYNQVDVAEKEPQAAFLVNALAVRNLALACRQVDAQLITFSTDYVFDGSARHPYVEEDLPHPPPPRPPGGPPIPPPSAPFAFSMAAPPTLMWGSPPPPRGALPLFQNGR